MIRKVKIKIRTQDLVKVHAALFHLANEAEMASMRVHPDGSMGDNVGNMAVPAVSRETKEARFRAQMLWRMLDKIQRKLQSSAMAGKGHNDEVKLKLEYPEAYYLWLTVLSYEANWPDDLLWELDPQL